MRGLRGLEIAEVMEGSRSFMAGLRPGDRIISVNGYSCRDELDFCFYASEEEVSIEIERPGGEKCRINLIAGDGEEMGIIPVSMKIKRCANNCIFCFIDQNPAGLRKPIYIKDEDYRYSFLYGNFVTLSNLTDRELARVVKQRMSPLYISIHAVDEEVRRKLLGNARARPILPVLNELKQAGIRMHGQIVLCPGINDDAALDESIRELYHFYPELESLAVIPVGLTKYRNNLYPLRRPDAVWSERQLSYVHRNQRKIYQETGVCFVYAADEFYLKANREIPESVKYDDFPQLENGVGMIRKFWDECLEQMKNLPADVDHKANFTLATGTAAVSVLNKILEKINKIKGVEIIAAGVSNRLYGESVTVAGLLAGKDLADALKGEKRDCPVLIPDVMLNPQTGRFIDDMSLKQAEKMSQREIKVLPSSGTEFIEALVEILMSGERKEENEGC